MPTPKHAAQRILCLYTGGTIGCVASEHGLSPAANILRSPILAMAAQHGVEIDYLEYAKLLDSSAMTPQDWLRIALDIDQHYADFDAFIILHGTDTLAWTAAALHWQLGSSQKPIILTGSQRPWLHELSDAPANFALALRVACDARGGVMVAFGGQILPAYAVKKLDADADQAFAAPNWSGQWPVSHSHRYQIRRVNADLNILAIKLYPACETWLAANLAHTECDAIVVECYGSGNLPDSQPLHAALRQVAARGTIIVTASQCIAGEIRQGHYSAGDIMQEIGALPAGRLSVEAAVTRLYTLLPQRLSKEDWLKLWQNDGLML